MTPRATTTFISTSARQPTLSAVVARSLKRHLADTVREAQARAAALRADSKALRDDESPRTSKASFLLRTTTMAKIYLSMSTPGAALVRVLSFERGKPIAEFSVGRRGVWRTSACGVADRHLWLSFDGQCLILRRDSVGDPVRVNGRPLQLGRERIAGMPCRVEFGGVKLVVDDRKPPVAALDAAVLRSSESTMADTEPSGTAMLETQMFDIRMFDDLEGKWGTRARVDASRPELHERMVDAGQATSVMPLEVLFQRGLAARAQAEEPRKAARRRRRERRSRPRATSREMAAEMGWQPRLRRWLAALRDQRVLAPRQKRVLALALLVPTFALVCHGLLPEAFGSSPGGRSTEDSSFIETASAAADDERFARESAALDAISVTNDSELPITTEPLPDSAAIFADAEAAVREAAVPTPSRTSRPASDAASGPTSERQAIDAFAAGDTARARALYAMLARRETENAAFAEAARILGLDLNADRSAEVGSDVRDERLTNGLRAPVR